MAFHLSPRLSVSLVTISISGSRSREFDTTLDVIHSQQGTVLSSIQSEFCFSSIFLVSCFSFSHLHPCYRAVMFEDYVSSVPPLLASVIRWFTTPTVLFLFLNLTIGTIVVASSFATRKPHQQRHESEPYSFFVRSPSLLHRVKSFSFSSHVQTIAESETHFVSKQIYEQERPQLARSPSLLQRLKSFNRCNYISHEYSSAPATQTHMSKQEREGEDEQAVVDEDGRKTLDEICSQVGRSKSDTLPTKLTRKMEKSISANTSSAHSKSEEDIAYDKRPATMKEDNEALAMDDEEVDVKADDFINKFRQQLKLQRLESIMRHR